jgi:hypothetical protein
MGADTGDETRFRFRRAMFPRLRKRNIGFAILVLLIASGCQAQDPVRTGWHLTCGGDLRFDKRDLDGEPGDPRQDDAGRALSAFLQTAEARRARLPTGPWLRVDVGAERLLFLTPVATAEAPYAMVALRRQEEGWSADEWGGCQPLTANGRAGPATWQLASPVGVETISLDALVREMRCSNGEPADGRLLPPTIAESPSAVTVTFVVEPVAALSLVTCGGAEPTRVRVELTERLGNRQLLDGGPYPPVPVAVAR